jgi:Tfp pilus assembly protein PilO
MRRQTLLLSLLAGVLVVAMYWMFMLKPAREELAAVEDQIAQQRVQQEQLEQQILRLKEVRAQSPEIEAKLLAAATVIPTQEALPALLRQLQAAAEDAGVDLGAVSTSRPTPIDGIVPATASIDISLQLDGHYFQLVDFLRRIEDPTLVPRGLQWMSASIVRGEYPELNVSLTGRVFAQLPVAPAVEEPAPAPDGDGAEQPTDDPEEGPDGTVAAPEDQQP